MITPPYPAETYYRVSVKALIFDDNQRLLLFKDIRGEWEVPGGGWDHAESYQECLKRELAEEAGAKVRSIGPLAFFYRHESKHAHPKISLALRVELVSNAELKPADDDITETRFVTKEEFLQLPFQRSEAPVKQYADQIWPAVEKNS